MEWDLNEVDQDAEQLMDILKLKPFFHKMVGNTKKIRGNDQDMYGIALPNPRASITPATPNRKISQLMIESII